MDSSQEMIVRRFLLGVASEAEACGVEEGILGGELDDSLLMHAEDDLIDAYCLGALSAEERRGYTENFLISEERRQRHAFAVALMEYAQKRATESPQSSRARAGTERSISIPFWKQMAGLATAACMFLALLAAFEYMQLRREMQLFAKSRDNLTQLPVVLAPGAGGVSRPNEISQTSYDEEQARIEPTRPIDLSSSTRAITQSEQNKLSIPSQAQFVRLQVRLPSSQTSESGQFVIKQVQEQGGKQLFAQDCPASRVLVSRQCTSVVPASLLPPGSYHFKFGEVPSEGKFQEIIDKVYQVERQPSVGAPATGSP